MATSATTMLDASLLQTLMLGGLSLLVTGASTVLWFLFKGVMRKLDDLSKLINAELRSMDVRLSVVEQHLGLYNPRSLHSND